MGVLSDLVVAGKDEAEAIVSSAGSHFKKWETLDVKGLDTIKLGSLAQIVSGKSVDDTDAVVNFINQPIASGDEDGPWVFEIPNWFRDALADFPMAKKEDVLTKWAATDEFQIFPDHAAKAAKYYLEGLIETARKARAAAKSLLLWMCL